MKLYHHPPWGVLLVLLGSVHYEGGVSRITKCLPDRHKNNLRLLSLSLWWPRIAEEAVPDDRVEDGRAGWARDAAAPARPAGPRRAGRLHVLQHDGARLWAGPELGAGARPAGGGAAGALAAPRRAVPLAHRRHAGPVPAPRPPRVLRQPVGVAQR